MQTHPLSHTHLLGVGGAEVLALHTALAAARREGTGVIGAELALLGQRLCCQRVCEGVCESVRESVSVRGAR